MKKIILFTIMAVTVMAYKSSAQKGTTDFSERLLVFGVKAGVNHANVYDTQGDEFSTDPKFGFATGGFVAISIAKNIGVQPELLFSQRGFKGTLGNAYDFSRTLSYIDLPVFFAFKPSRLLTVLAGPQVSFLLQQRDVFANGATNTQQQQEFENANVRKNTLCFVTGIDINLKHIVLGARAGWDVVNNNGDGTSTSPRYKNAWVQATLGYRFYH